MTQIRPEALDRISETHPDGTCLTYHRDLIERRLVHGLLSKLPHESVMIGCIATLCMIGRETSRDSQIRETEGDPISVGSILETLANTMLTRRADVPFEGDSN